MASYFALCWSCFVYFSPGDHLEVSRGIQVVRFKISSRSTFSVIKLQISQTTGATAVTGAVGVSVTYCVDQYSACQTSGSKQTG